ncbi:MAG: alpha/beta hydrolase-fold protein [Planctomycetota bacterium]
MTVTPGTLNVHPLPDPSRDSATRRVWVWTPPGYERNASKRFPVFYLMDGQNLFAGGESGSWHVDRAAAAEIAAGRVEPLVLVGVENGGRDREGEYTRVKWRDKGGHAERHLSFLIDEVRPFVERNYRVRRGAAATAVGGSSLGALFSLFVGLRHPESFGSIMAMSPSVFWGEDDMLGFVEEHAAPSTRIWLDVGARETLRMRKGLRQLAAVMIRCGWHRGRGRRGGSLRVVEDPAGKHDETSWGRRFARALRFLFPRQRALPLRHGVRGRSRSVVR